MSPRRNRPKHRRKAEEEDDRALGASIVVGGPAGWQVRAVTSERALKPYVCPDCNQTIQPGTPHVVAWRSGDDEGRRHWHKGCWERWARTAR